MQGLQLTFAEPFVVLCGTDVRVWEPVSEHVRHGRGNLVRCGPQGLRGTPPPLQASVKGPQGAVGADDRLGGQAKGLCSPVALFHGAALEALAARDVILGGEAQPGAKGFVIGPFAHVCTNFRQGGLRQGSADAIDGDESTPGEPQDRGTRVARRGVLAVGVRLATWWSGRLSRGGCRGGRLEAWLDH